MPCPIWTSTYVRFPLDAVGRERRDVLDLLARQPEPGEASREPAIQVVRAPLLFSAFGRVRAEEGGRDALADQEPEVGDLAALAAGLHLDLDVADAVDLLDGRREHVLAERLVRRVLALADAQEPTPVGDREPPRRTGPHEPQAVLVERERVLAREPGSGCRG